MHQKRSRLFASLMFVLVLVLFAVAFYDGNRWLNPAAV